MKISISKRKKNPRSRFLSVLMKALSEGDADTAFAKGDKEALAKSFKQAYKQVVEAMEE